MKGRLSRLYNQFSKNLLSRQRMFHVEEEAFVRQADAFKIYPRFKKYPLPKPAVLNAGLQEVLEKRRTFRSYDQSKPVSLQNLSTLLYHAGGITSTLGGGRRSYPSGGALYPLEMYVATEKTSELPAGLYHYDVEGHVLEQLGGAALFEEIRSNLIWDFSTKAPTFLIVTAVWERNFKKYRDFGYPVVLLEAGHLGQNIQLVATSLGLKSCPLAGFLSEDLSQSLDIDPQIEAPIHTVAIAEH